VAVRGHPGHTDLRLARCTAQGSTKTIRVKPQVQTADGKGKDVPKSLLPTLKEPKKVKKPKVRSPKVKKVKQVNPVKVAEKKRRRRRVPRSRAERRRVSLGLASGLLV
jgi:hypothetical protein